MSFLRAFSKTAFLYFGLTLILGNRTVEALKIHGNWCGPYHPSNFEYNYKEPLNHYTDSTDKACMKHDFIYSNYWTTIKADEMNPYILEYPFEKQFEADLLLVNDIEAGLVQGEWGCEGTKVVKTYKDRIANCKYSKMENSLCKRVTPGNIERMFSRVIQMAMMVKIKLHYKIGLFHENPTVCKDLEEPPSRPSSPSSLDLFQSLPDFCTIQDDFSESANREQEPEVSEKIQTFFQFFQGEEQKRRASTVLVKYVKACNLRKLENLGSSEKIRFVLNADVIEEALQQVLRNSK